MVFIKLKEVALEELVQRAQRNADNGESFTEICTRFTPLVMKYAKRNHLAAVFEDAAAEGWLAVVEAVRNYDPAKKIRFAGYVDSRVKYAIWNFFKKNKRKWQMEIPDATTLDGEEISILELIPVNDKDLAEKLADEIDFKAQIKKVKEFFPEISNKQQKVINLTVINKLQLKEAAQQLGITPQAVHNLQKRGLHNLKDKLSRGSSRVSEKVI